MIYLSLDKVANMILLHNYIHHSSNNLVNTNESILDKLAIIKIECPLMVVFHAGSNDFMIKLKINILNVMFKSGIGVRFFKKYNLFVIKSIKVYIKNCPRYFHKNIICYSSSLFTS